MREVVTWDTYFMDMAISAAKKSKDPKTQVGCIIVNVNYDPVAFGYNGFAAGAEETPELWSRPTKYDHVIHAETNAVGRAARRGCPTQDTTAYITAFPCLPCAKVLAAAGVIRVVAKTVLHGWNDDNKKAANFLDRAGILWEVWEDAASIQ